MLTPRQQTTIDNLKRKNITTPADIIAYCLKKLKLSRQQRDGVVGRRHHSKEYYFQIIDHYK